MKLQQFLYPFVNKKFTMLYSFTYSLIGNEKEAGEILSFIKDLKANTLIKKDMATSEFFRECFTLGYNEYLKKLYYFDEE